MLLYLRKIGINLVFFYVKILFQINMFWVQTTNFDIFFKGKVTQAEQAYTLFINIHYKMIQLVFSRSQFYKSVSKFLKIYDLEFTYIFVLLLIPFTGNFKNWYCLFKTNLICYLFLVHPNMAAALTNLFLILFPLSSLLHRMFYNIAHYQWSLFSFELFITLSWIGLRIR